MYASFESCECARAAADKNCLRLYTACKVSPKNFGVCVKVRSPAFKAEGCISDSRQITNFRLKAELRTSSFHDLFALGVGRNVSAELSRPIYQKISRLMIPFGRGFRLTR